MNIYIGNLNYKVGEEDIKELFQEYGEVSSVKLILDKETGRSKGFAFVDMENDSEANAAIQELNRKEFQGRALVVNEARPRTEGGGGNFNRGGNNFRNDRQSRH